MIGRTNALTASTGGGGSTDMSGLRLKYLVFTSEAKWIEEDGGQITAGQVVTLKSGKNVSTAGNGTSDYVPNLTFDGWSSPLAISNNTITIPSTISQNVVVGAMYHTTDGSTVYVDKLGNVTSTIPSTKTDLVRVYYPSSVTNIGNSAFNSCYALSSVVIPSSVTSIGSSAFYTCYALSSVVIPSSVTSIGSSAFNSCRALSSIVIPSSVTSIGDSAFYNCFALSSIVIPSSVTSIGDSAFNSCYALSSVVIPSSVTSIGSSAFYNCSALGIVTILATTPPTLGGTNAFNTTNQKRIYVPASSVDAYKAATNWSTFASIIYAIPS